ncbi:MAG: alcohol dehydrogenase catalytic domain-containing protein, partial [Chloroflexi bacterium]|nr:alcohol dehydrogenase catalytic domain-containing protein [Chloroflexota bacterium]
MIPKRMAAVHFRGSGRVAIDEVDTPTPSGRDVLVRVEAAAICGTDRENLEGAGQSTVPGHECAGEVVSIDRPSWIRVGTRVAVNCHVTCLRCEHCLKGDLYFCDELKVIGFDRDGGFAEYMLVPEQCCMPLPDDISFEQGALLVDVLGTAYRAVMRAGLVPGSSIAIWGAGPI